MAKIMCDVCGKKTGVFSRFYLSNGGVLCSSCSSWIRPIYRPFAQANWNVDSFKEYFSYVNEEEPELLKMFTSTDMYGQLCIDEEHGLFMPYPGTVFRFRDLAEYSFDFRGEKFKEGIISDKVVGEVIFDFIVDKPYIGGQIIVCNDKAKASVKGIINKRVEYGLPDCLVEFYAKFDEVAEKYAPEIEQAIPASDLDKALSMFMYESLSDVTYENLKEQKKMLMKVFHSDVTGDITDPRAARINSSYELIVSALGSQS